MLCSSAALAQDATWSAHGSLTLKGGTDRHIGEMDFFVPLWQDNDSLFYADLRAQTDDDGNQEGNIGFGFRQMGEQWIVGGYGFFDWRKSDETGNTFIQGMVGVEAMTETLDLRLNAYIPESGEQSALAATEVSLVGGSLQMRTGNERALPGVDGEIGYRLWESKAGDAELRAFAGGFYFNADDYRTVAGPRGRIEARLFDLGFLGAGSRFTLGVEVTHDGVRDTEGFAVARLTIPLGGGRRSGRGGLERRMADYVVRDVDVVTGTAATGAAEAVAYVNTGIDVGAVSALTGADNLVEAAAGGGEGDLFILDGSDGDFTTETSTVLAAGQVLLGGASSIELVGLDSGTQVTWTAPGARPTINADVAGVGAIVLADDTMVIGLDIENTSLTNDSFGIYAEAVSGAYLIDNAIVTNADTAYGIYLNVSSENTIAGNSITTSGNAAMGLYWVDSTYNTVTDNTIVTSGDGSAGIFLVSNSHFNTLIGNSFTTSGSTAYGIYLHSSASNTFEDNIITTGQANAFGFYLVNGATVDNTGTGNSYSGPAGDCTAVDGATTGANSIDLCP